MGEYADRHILEKDAFTRSHFNSWLYQYVHERDQESVRIGIEQLLLDHPDLIDKGYSWPETRRLSEVN